MKVNLKVKTILCSVAATVAISSSAFAMSWNTYDNMTNYAPSSMHQGYYTIDNLNTTSIDLYAPPIYVLSANEVLVKPDGSRENIGRITYRLDYKNKKAWMLDLKKPLESSWVELNLTNTQQLKTLNKIFHKAYGIDFATAAQVK